MEYLKNNGHLHELFLFLTQVVILFRFVIFMKNFQQILIYQLSIFQILILFLIIDSQSFNFRSVKFLYFKKINKFLNI